MAKQTTVSFLGTLWLSLVWSQPSLAYCDNYISDSVASYDLTTICRSSLGKPFYRIVRHLYDDGSVLIFSFAPRSRKLLCHQYEVKDQFYNKCQNFGINLFPKTFKGSKFTVAMVDLSTASNTAIADFYSEENIYQYPEITELVGVDNCFAIVHNKFKITLGYNENTIADMASCLLELEMFFDNNKELTR